MKTLSLLAAACSVIALAACTPAVTPAPVEAPAAVEAPVEAPPVVLQSIAEIAATNPDFSTLFAAVGAAGLGETLSGPGPFTVFAPTNAAFAALPAGTVEDLLKPENKDKLAAVLTYHVVPGAVMAADLPTTATDVATVNGAMVSVVAASTGATVGGAKITATDIAASNGVVHVIDTVLLPPAK
jgi:uncharacterized surface protein with fasciclin (FAS1) repeats